MNRDARTTRWRRSKVAALVPMTVLLTVAPAGMASALPEPGTHQVTAADAAPQRPESESAVVLPASADSAAAAANKAQQRLMDEYPSVIATGLATGSWPLTPWSSRGEIALAWAMDQIGKPYIWGAQGPDAFDCSGLSSQAWHVAGVDIPRTSQEQWHDLPKVGDGNLLPGDLVVFFGDASHVGVYAGDGLVVQAPRPGRGVTLSGMPVLGVVRPS